MDPIVIIQCGRLNVWLKSFWLIYFFNNKALTGIDNALLEEACGTYRPKWCFCGPSCQINWVTVYSDGSNQSCTYLLVHGTNRQHANSASKSCHPKCEKPRYERNKFTSIKISRTVCLIFQNCNFIVSWYYSATNTKIEIMEEMEIFYF